MKGKDVSNDDERERKRKRKRKIYTVICDVSLSLLCVYYKGVL